MEIRCMVAGDFFTNCYIAWGGGPGPAVLIDPADDAPGLLRLLDSLELTPEAVLLTHGHYDHVGGVKGLHEATGAPVSFPEKDLVLPENFTAGPLFYTELFDEGDRFTVGSMTFDVLSTPGHTPGSACLRCGDALFTGDTLFQGSCGRTDMPGGDMDQMMASLRRLGALEGDYRVFPGHGGDTTLDTERRYNYYMKEAAG